MLVVAISAALLAWTRHHGIAGWIIGSVAAIALSGITLLLNRHNRKLVVHVLSIIAAVFLVGGVLVAILLPTFNGPSPSDVLAILIINVVCGWVLGCATAKRG
jgi:hypothetical protein